MNLPLALMLGLGFGAGLAALLLAVFPAKVTLADRLAALLDTPPVGPATSAGITEADTSAAGWSVRLGAPFVRLLAGAGLPTAKTRADLATLGRPVERHLAEKAATAITGLLVAVLLTGMAAMIGMHPSPLMIVVGILVLAALGFLAPDLGVRSEAAKRREQARASLSTLLDLVTLALAGGAGIDQALADATATGDGWAFRQFRRALTTSVQSRTPAWQALGALGEEIGVAELVELAATVNLAGAEGAKIRGSLSAKAASMRDRQRSAAYAAANAASERMSLPVVILAAGFLIFLGAPAIAHAMSGL